MSQPEPGQGAHQRPAALALIAGAVALQVLGAVLLKWLADLELDRAPLVLAVGMTAVLALNGLRLAVWSLAHSRYPVVSTVPYAALFFPAMLPVAFAFGDRIGALQIVGAALVTAGVAYLYTSEQR